MEFIGTIISYGIIAIIVIVLLVMAFNFFVALLPIIIVVLILGGIIFVLDKIFGFTDEESMNGIEQVTQIFLNVQSLL